MPARARRSQVGERRRRPTSSRRARSRTRAQVLTAAATSEAARAAVQPPVRLHPGPGRGDRRPPGGGATVARSPRSTPRSTSGARRRGTGRRCSRRSCRPVSDAGRKTLAGLTPAQLDGAPRRGRRRPRPGRARGAARLGRADRRARARAAGCSATCRRDQRRAGRRAHRAAHRAQLDVQRAPDRAGPGRGRRRPSGRITVTIQQGENVIDKGHPITAEQTGEGRRARTSTHPTLDVARLGWLRPRCRCSSSTLLLAWVWRFRSRDLASHERAAAARPDRAVRDARCSSSPPTGRCCRSSCRRPPSGMLLAVLLDAGVALVVTGDPRGHRRRGPRRLARVRDVRPARRASPGSSPSAAASGSTIFVQAGHRDRHRRTRSSSRSSRCSATRDLTGVLQLCGAAAGGRGAARRSRRSARSRSSATSSGSPRRSSCSSSPTRRSRCCAGCCVETPGTYHHSLMVGNLAERAAEAIGADPLLTRVAAYYHDIGKLANPLAFIENQAGGENVHDELDARGSRPRCSSSTSPTGIDLAYQYKLPKPLIAFIPQHHGTALMSYFYARAQGAGRRAVRRARRPPDGARGGGRGRRAPLPPRRTQAAVARGGASSCSPTASRRPCARSRRATSRRSGRWSPGSSRSGSRTASSTSAT